jgi:GntR family transcriptional regulator
MITLDRDSPLPVSEQLVEQLRYQLAAGRYRPGERLPSTRVLADQLGLSFHTTRKAYQRLAEEGLLDARRGGGFHVRERPVLSRAERMERGAAVVQEVLQKLLALGLSEEETDYLLEEQRTYAEHPGGRRKLLFAAPARELAESGAEQLTGALQERVDGVALAELGRHADADVVVASMPHLREALMALPQAEAVGVVVGWPHDVLARVARLGPTDPLALLVRQGDAVEPLTDLLRADAGFTGPVFALAVEADRARLEGLIRRAALVLYTPQVRRRVRPLVGERPHAELAPVVTAESLARVREAVGR